MIASKNIQLGKIEIPVPQGKAGEQTVEVRFTYDINGILEVDIKALSSGEKRHILIVDEKSSMSPKQIQNKLEELALLKLYPKDREENGYLISRCEALFEQSSPSIREFLLFEKKVFQEVLETQNDFIIKRTRIRFNRAMDVAEERMHIFQTPEEFTEFSTRWYEEAKREEEMGDFWFGKGHLTS